MLIRISVSDAKVIEWFDSAHPFLGVYCKILVTVRNYYLLIDSVLQHRFAFLDHIIRYPLKKTQWQ